MHTVYFNVNLNLFNYVFTLKEIKKIIVPHNHIFSIVCMVSTQHCSTCTSNFFYCLVMINYTRAKFSACSFSGYKSFFFLIRVIFV